MYYETDLELLLPTTQCWVKGGPPCQPLRILTDSHPVEFAISHMHCSQGANMAPTPVRERLCDTDYGKGQSIPPLHSRKRRPLLHDTERKDSQPRSLTRVLFCLCFGTSEANQTQPSSPGIRSAGERGFWGPEESHSNSERGWLKFSGSQPRTHIRIPCDRHLLKIQPCPPPAHLGPTDSEPGRWARHVCAKCSPRF